MKQSPIAVFSAAVSLAVLAGCAQDEERGAGRGGYVAVIASDVDASADWYESVFDLAEAHRLVGDGYEIALLSGEGALVEIIEFTPQAPEDPGRTLGIFKAGFILSDFDSRITKWRAQGVNFLGDGRVFYDKALGYHSTILLDPDGARIQVFGVSRIEPKE